MYKIYLDNTLAWSNKDLDKTLINPIANLELNKVGSASFSILPNNPLYNSITKMNTIMTIYKNNSILFKGRVFSINTNFRKIKNVNVEGILSYFNDSIVRPYNFKGSLIDYYTFLINQHNSQVSTQQQFKIGNITVEDNNDYIVRASSDNPKTWQEINDKLINLLGGYLVVRFANDGVYLDYLKSLDDVSTQKIEFASNLLDLNIESTSENITTCLIPYGATIKNEDTQTESIVDITSVNDGLDYICDENAIALYGKIFETVKFDDITLPQNLLTKARLYLSDKVRSLSKITVKALDLNLTDKTIESFKLGDNIEVISSPHNINERMLLTAYSIDLSTPTNSTITLGLEKSSYLELNSNNTRDEITKQTNIVKKEIGDSVSSVNSKVQGLESEITNLNDSILDESITYVNSQIENSKIQTSSLLSQYVLKKENTEIMEELKNTWINTSKETIASFEGTKTTLTKADDELLKKIEEFKTYIRFNADGIEIGKSNDKLKSVYTNNKLSFIYNETVEVAYISDDKLYITNGEFLDMLIIGKFAFIPRSNGNLSFTKVR